MPLTRDVRNHIEKAREAATLAVETYNRPGTVFRTGAYLVLMTIAWTALFHALFLKRKKKPYYKRPGGRRYERVEGDYRAWELKECLRQYYGDQNPPARKNLEFFVGLRNKVEHRLLPQLDADVFGECQACLINFEKFLCTEFGDKYALRASLAFALQFSDFNEPSQLQAMRSASKKVTKNIRDFVVKFRSSLGTDIEASQEFSYKVFLVPKIGRDAKSSDVAVEFIKYDASKPEEMEKYERLVALIKPKFISVANLGGLKATDVVKQVANRIDKKFTNHSNRLCYLHYHARPKRGDARPEFCDTRYCYYDEVHKDYIYTKQWVEFLVQELAKAETYDSILTKPNLPQAIAGPEQPEP